MPGDDQSSQPICSVDPYEYLKMVRNPDGSITRLTDFPATPIEPRHTSNDCVVRVKDVQINPTRNTSVRIFLPRRASAGDPTATKLPLIVYFHGGGFVLLSASSTIFHDHCEKLATELDSIIVSVDYRLAPEHRLPAAYDDAVESLYWITSAKDDWLVKHGDFSKCYLMGISAGGNIAYYAGLRAAAAAASSEANDLESLKIRGLILIHPFFGAAKRSASEIRLINDAVLPLSGTDLMWELSLPSGEDRDHEYCNPCFGDGSKLIEDIKRLGCRVLVTGCDGDPLIDKQVELAKMLEMKGVYVIAEFSEGGQHGVDLFPGPDYRPESFWGALRKFVGQ